MYSLYALLVMMVQGLKNNAAELEVGVHVVVSDGGTVGRAQLEFIVPVLKCEKASAPWCIV